MTQHVWPDRRETGPCRGAGDQVVHGLPGERLPAFGDEQPGEPIGAGGEVSLDRAQFVAGDRLLDREAILEPTYPQPGPLDIDLVGCPNISLSMISDVFPMID
jgi:hypothetical protein